MNVMEKYNMFNFWDMRATYNISWFYAEKLWTDFWTPNILLFSIAA